MDSLTSKLSRLPLILRAGIALALLGVVPLAVWVVTPRGTVEAPAPAAEQASTVEAAPAAQATPSPTAETTEASEVAPVVQKTPDAPNWPLVWIAWGVWALAIGTAVQASFTYRLWRDAVKKP